ncbi:MAG: FAD-binding oxidoreductase [Thermodesulfobacteriota bacterium]|nr:FAD-binding oxidoreductase [Thermodesulfobacteriota bacterium]
MTKQNIRQQIEGYGEIQAEIEVLRKYAHDRRTDKGTVDRVINLLHPKELNIKVSEIIEETPSSKTLRLISTDGYLPSFQAGQYINIFVNLAGIRSSRPYSIASSPAQTAYYDVTVRRVEDGFVSNYLLDEIKVGDSFVSTSPAGLFYYNPLFHRNNLVFLAGGSGITPFMSMIRDVTDRGLERDITLIYGSRDPEDIIFKEELEERAKRHGNFIFTPVISEPPSSYSGHTGFITAELMRELLGDIKDKMFYLCGPEEIYNFCLPELDKLGVPKKKIRQEVFGPPKKVTEEPGWPSGVPGDATFEVRIKDGMSIPARAGEPLMISLERAGITIPTSCRSGECSLCRTKLLSGEVFQPRGVKVRKSDRQFGYIHACMAYPLKNLEILL